MDQKGERAANVISGVFLESEVLSWVLTRNGYGPRLKRANVEASATNTAEALQAVIALSSFQFSISQ